MVRVLGTAMPVFSNSKHHTRRIVANVLPKMSVIGAAEVRREDVQSSGSRMAFGSTLSP